MTTQWKTRKRGTYRQRGKPFPVSPSMQLKKSKLPKIVAIPLHRKRIGKLQIVKDGMVVGYASYYTTKLHGKEIFLDGLTVFKGHRHKGYATKLINKLKRRYDVIEASALPSIAKKFYAPLGFRITPMGNYCTVIWRKGS